MSTEQHRATTPEADFERLRGLDTPTVCNAIEQVLPERRGFGYTSESFVCARPQLAPVVGYARTATIRSCQPNARSPAEARAHRLAYLKYLADGPMPFIAVIQDLDGQLAGCGAFWGEVQSTIHHALGAAGGITDGAMRDLDALAPGFQLLARKVVASHAFVHLVEFAGDVSVGGMAARSGDLIHLDRHGAVDIPAEAAARVPAAADLVQRREAVILKACRRPDFNYEALVAAFVEADRV